MNVFLDDYMYQNKKSRLIIVYKATMHTLSGLLTRVAVFDPEII